MKRNADNSDIVPTTEEQPSAQKRTRIGHDEKHVLQNGRKSKSRGRYFENYQQRSSMHRQNIQQQPTWNEFKQLKKVDRLKRKQQRGNYSTIVKAKQIGEALRCRKLQGGVIARSKLIEQLYDLLKEKCLFEKFAVAHDTARLIQWLLKYSSVFIREQVAKELTPSTIDLIQSKYGQFVIRRLLKYGTNTVRHSIIDQFSGHVLKLTSHTTSAPVFEYAYANWATTAQKHSLQQEFYGDLFKSGKDTTIHHVRDAYTACPELKPAVLGALKANLIKIINKECLDSALVHTVLEQYFSECTADDRNELIGILTGHVVVISNSKAGVKVAQQLIWHGTNKDRKAIMKAIKPHIVDLAQHEIGHLTLVTLLDTVDDTVLLNKVITSELVKNTAILMKNEHSRKILIWLVAPENPTFFHPKLLEAVKMGREQSTSKKSVEIRRKEITQSCIDGLLDVVVSSPSNCLENGLISMVTGHILKTTGFDEQKRTVALKQICQYIVSTEWKIKKNDVEMFGVEDGGVHMTLKKLCQHDSNLTVEYTRFTTELVENLTLDTIKMWSSLNRGCFLLLTIYENAIDNVKSSLKALLAQCRDILQEQTTAGAKRLLQIIGIKS